MTQLVGILNVTPDSFSDGGLFMAPDKAVAKAEELFTDGAALVDVGAESTNPKAEPLTPEEEWRRLAPVLPELLQHYPGKISVDTYHPATAERALILGDVIINDVTGMADPAMIDLVTRYWARCVISQLPAREIRTAHRQEPINDVAKVKDDLLAKAAELESRGLERQKIILDPGIGFGKTKELNWKLLEFAREVPEYQVMIGYSKKRFLGEGRMDKDVNLEAGRLAIASGAAYLRVHDVAGHRQLLQ